METQHGAEIRNIVGIRVALMGDQELNRNPEERLRHETRNDEEEFAMRPEITKSDHRPGI